MGRTLTQVVINMTIVQTPDGKIYAQKQLADSRWDFIEKYLKSYSWDEQVSLSNDAAIVLEVVESGINPYDFLKLPETEREYSNYPFYHVGEYVDNLQDKTALYSLLEDVDRQLFERAKEDYLTSH